MIQITFTPEQMGLLASASDPIIILDVAGNPVGRLMREQRVFFSAARIAEARRRLRTEAGGVTTAQLLNNLGTLGKSP